MTAMKMAANKNACRIPYLALLRGERNSGHRDALAPEPRDAFLHHVPVERVGAGSARSRDLRDEIAHLAGADARERCAQAVPHDGLPGSVDPVVAEVHRAIPVAAGEVLDPYRDG